MRVTVKGFLCFVDLIYERKLNVGSAFWAEYSCRARAVDVNAVNPPFDMRLALAVGTSLDPCSRSSTAKAFWFASPKTVRPASCWIRPLTNSVISLLCKRSQPSNRMTGPS